MLGAITLPTLGISLLGLGGVLRDSISVVRVALVVSSLFLLFVLVGLADFLIEAAPSSGGDRPKIPIAATVEIQRTVVISLVAIPALAAVAIGCYRMVRGMKAEIDSRRAGPTGSGRKSIETTADSASGRALLNPSEGVHV